TRAPPPRARPGPLPRTPRLVCVEYPGLVRDVGAMLRTLGGEQGVSRECLISSTWQCTLVLMANKPPCMTRF
uniref:Transcription factor IIIC subunit Tfc1/Sfc1 triple barrel domain-containing protein n=1 Tax=Accipiter nisus TaxID=211598 RepID=A0A8B9NAK7_9AVES